MKQTTEVNQETIESNSTVKNTEKVEIVTPETLDIPTYDYGNWQNTLDAPLALRNLNTWWFKVWNFNITANWTKVITWVWFKPSMVQFFPCSWNWNPSDTWMWAMTTTNQFAVNNQNSWFITSQAIYYWNPVRAKWTFASMDNDWFTITISWYTAYTDVWYIAFK